MADNTLIIPPAQVQNVSAGGQTQSATDAGTPQPGLQPGTLVSGTIAGKDANGNYLLKSAQGTIPIQSKVPLTYNSDVVIRIGTNTAGNSSTRIVSVNGQPFADFITPEPETTDSISASLLVPPTESPAAPASTSVLSGVIVAAPPPEQQPAGAPLAEGTQVNVRLPEATATPQTPEEQTQQQTGATPSSSVSTSVAASVNVATQPQQVAGSIQPAVVQQQPAAPAPASPATATPVAATLPSVAETDLAPQKTVTPSGQGDAAQNQKPQTTQITQVQTPQAQATSQTPPATVSALYSAYTKQSVANSPPGVPAPAAGSNTPAPAAQNTTLPAQIVNVDEHGNITLQTPLGNVTVKADSLPALTNLSAGTAVTLELPANTAAQVLSAEPAALNELAASWQSLKDILNVATTSNTPAANALLARLPQLGPEFLAQSTNFFSALIQGDARKLLGDDTIDTLKQNGRQDLLEKFSGELTNLGASFTNPEPKQVANWQTLFLPFVYQEVLQQARVYVKRDAPKKDRSNAKSTTDTRFVVEVDLSDLGPLQMDGLVRKKEKATAFDLVIRSHQSFTPEDQSAMAAIYNNAAQLTGFKGSLAFQVTRNFPVKPLEEAAAGDAHSITA